MTDIDETLESYDEWARSCYQEIRNNLDPAGPDGEVDPIHLNRVLTKFAGYFAWSVTFAEIEENKLNIMQVEYDEWYKEQRRLADTLIREESGVNKKGTLDEINSRVTSMLDGEVEQRLKALVDQKSKVDLLKYFIRVLEKQAGILQTLSSNMRSEMFFSGGIPIGNEPQQKQKTSDAKSVMMDAMGNHTTEEN